MTRYRRCIHEVFAHFGEAARWDGLLERLTLYSDLACTKVSEVCPCSLSRCPCTLQPRLAEPLLAPARSRVSCLGGVQTGCSTVCPTLLTAAWYAFHASCSGLFLWPASAKAPS